MGETLSSPPPLPGLKFNFFYFLPKAVSSEATPRSPSPRPKMKKTADTGIILRRASTRFKNNGRFWFKGPRSPKASCIGSFANKGKNKHQKNKRKKRKNNRVGTERPNTASVAPPSSSLILKLFGVFKKKGKKVANPYSESSSTSCIAAASKELVPKLGQAKTFSRSRGGSSGINWRVHNSSVVGLNSLSSIPNKRGKRNGVVVVENIELLPRKEINLWKKRMVAPPPPLLL